MITSMWAPLIVGGLLIGLFLVMFGARELGARIAGGSVALGILLPFLVQLVKWVLAGGAVLLVFVVLTKLFWRALVAGAGRSMRQMAADAKARDEGRRQRREALPPPRTPVADDAGETSTSAATPWLE